MPHNHEWQSRIKGVECEYLAMRQAADRFLKAALDDPTIVSQDLRHREIAGASQNLEGHTSFACLRNLRPERGSTGRPRGPLSRRRSIY